MDPKMFRAIGNKSSLAYEVAQAINASKSFNTVFIFKSLSVLYFVSFFLSMLFYLGAMQWAIEKVGWILQVRSRFLAK
jgi:pyrimidine nucleoside transport protein